jgi:hypothetical protein
VTRSGILTWTLAYLIGSGAEGVLPTLKCLEPLDRNGLASRSYTEPHFDHAASSRTQ